jgi:hypothetical protein
VNSKQQPVNSQGAINRQSTGNQSDNTKKEKPPNRPCSSQSRNLCAEIPCDQSSFLRPERFLEEQATTLLVVA